MLDQIIPNFNTMKTREAFHKLIDDIEDDRLLQVYFKMINDLNTNKQSNWNALSKEEQDEVLSAYDESYSGDNLVAHNVVMEKHLKWRKK